MGRGRWPLTLVLFALVAAISERQRWEIALGVAAGKSPEEAGQEAGCSRGAARRWAKRFQSTGACEEKKRPGRPPAVSRKAEKRAAQLGFVKGPPDWAGVADTLEAEGLTKGRVSAQTARRAAHRGAKAEGKRFRYVRSKPRRALADSNIAKRLAFAQANTGRAWDRVMFTDRKRFQFRYPGEAVEPGQWVEVGQRWEVLSASHPRSYNVYCGLTVHGCVAVRPCVGTTGMHTRYQTQRGQQARNITKNEYRDVLSKSLLPHGHLLLGPGPWTIQQDGDPSHGDAARQVATFNRANCSNITLLPHWPPNSPDLNLIENVWSYVQARVDKAGCKTWAQFCSTVDYELTHLSQKYIKSLYASMPTRIAKCIELKGGKTGY